VVAVSADGNTAIVGGRVDNANAGAAWIFTRTAGVWSQQGSKLVGTGAVGAANQGFSVAISADGNTALVGGWVDNTNIGAAWVFVRNGGTWSQQGAKLVGAGAVGGALQGYSVALSADGNTALIGGDGDNSFVGAAWVFTRSGTVWTQQGAKLTGTGSVGASYQGSSVALSADGNTAMVGGYSDNSVIGAAWVYTRSGGVWSQQGSKLIGTGAASGGANQGLSVSLSGDGNTAAVGGRVDSTSVGAVWMFTRSAGTWTQQGSKLTVSDNLGAAGFGTCVSLAADGNTLLAGGSSDKPYGAAWLFARKNGAWSQQGSKLVGTGTVGNNVNEGSSLALSADARTAMVGGLGDNSSAGATWVFVFASPTIVSIKDVPNDQGGKVNLHWTPGMFDLVPGDPIDQYWIWRQVPSSSAQRALAQGATLLGADATRIPAGRVFRAIPNGTDVYYWEYVGSQVAHGYPGYSYTTSTTSDSIAGSNPYTLFMVETEKTSTGEYWSSEPDSGYSVDNIAPASPAPLTGDRSAGVTYLHWGTNSEADLAGYRLYRGNSAGFVPAPGNLVSAQPDTGYADAGAANSYYKLSAVDVHGNESGYALLSPSGTASVEGSGSAAFALYGVRPNPATAASLNVAFSLATGAPARLELVDVSGRRVLTREAVGAGLHVVDLAVGHSVPSGLYWIRLTQGARTSGVRVAVIQ
jgi:hypothetical protein